MDKLGFYAQASYYIAAAKISPVLRFSSIIPSTLAGVLMIGIFSWFRGKDLADDVDFQKRIADPEQRQIVYGESATLMGKVLSRDQWTAMWIFIASIVVVAILGAFQSLRPLINGKPLLAIGF